MRGLSLPASSSCSWSLVTMQCVAPVEVNTMSDFWSASSRLSIVSQLTSTSGYCAASSVARSMPRLSRRARVMPLEARWVRRSRDMVPAPTIVTSVSAVKGSPRISSARMSASSAAAEEMDTAPLEMEVSERTRLPAATATLRRRESTLPALPSSAVAEVKQALTCERIWPSPTTRESSPAETRRRCQTASSPPSMKRFAQSVSSSSPEWSWRKSSTSRMAALRSAATRWSSKRLQVESTAASCTEGQDARMRADASFHSGCWMLSFSRTSTVAVLCERPMTRGWPGGPPLPPFFFFLPPFPFPAALGCATFPSAAPLAACPAAAAATAAFAICGSSTKAATSGCMAAPWARAALATRDLNGVDVV
mmetsp:Transcript_10265/g.27929  ORF Transcript_10265/g.27929 Transcript_10265/m.27929 type:complete len:366 (+) Transcript_10265:702-1799(+)